MPKQSYLPSSDIDFNVWLANFQAKIGAYSVILGLTGPQLTVIEQDRDNFNHWLVQSNLFKDESQERVAFKELQRFGPVGTPAGTLPTPPIIPSPPTSVLPGIEPRIRTLVQFIKAHPSYTVAIGQDLGIIGSEIVIDLSSLKPILTLVKLVTGVDVLWKKGVAGALRIEKSVLVTAGPPPVWAFLAIDTEPNYLDTSPVTTSQLWQYRAAYIINDALVGQWSDVASIAVG